MMSALPLLFWNICIEEINKFAHQEMDKVKEKDNPDNVICGVKWQHDTTLGEYMVFMGILLHMCLIFPLRGHSYVLYWSYGAIACPVFDKMQLQTFQQIPTGLHFNDNEMVEGTNDALRKFRPLLNIVKVTLQAFIRIGSEVALDEASVTSRSSYGIAVICFNTVKNCGKFHFHFYLLCCVTTFACVRMKVNTKNNSDNPDPDQTMGTIYNTARMSKLNKFVMEMCQPLFGSYRTVNMDNFYTSPAVLILLNNQKVYACGTVRKNRWMVPKCIVWTKKEAKYAGRGGLQWAVILRIFAFG
jgi:hypothetical protein